ncbi:MAG: hypothetical protein WC546_02735 [Candidatus Omnitrophota bacterium]
MLSNNFYCQEKLDKTTLGLISLCKMLREHKIFSIKEFVTSGKIRYELTQEEFIDPVILKDLLQGLKIRAPGSSSCVLIKKGAF